jgi:hypothetical protein
MPDQFKSPILCFDVCPSGIPMLLKSLVEIGNETHGLAHVELEKLGNNNGEPIKNLLRNKCILTFKKLK